MRFLKNPRVLSVTASAAFALALLASAPFVQAASLSASQISAITNLLQTFGVDAATVANVQSVLEGNAPATPAVSSSAPAPLSNASSEGVAQATANASSCSVISGNLQVGSSGEDVTRLQQFLSQDKAVYPQGLVTGYFGEDTQAAVQRWQTDRGIVATGTPDSTGYGVVGPHTRGDMNREMEVECEGGDHNATASTSPESSSGDASASSTSDHSGTGDN